MYSRIVYAIHRSIGINTHKIHALQSYSKIYAAIEVESSWTVSHFFGLLYVYNNIITSYQLRAYTFIYLTRQLLQ